MIIIEHRINTIEQLMKVAVEHGAEIDLRSDPTSGQIYLHHDPFTPGVAFSEWIRVFRDRKISGPLILNTKEDGLEKTLMDICLAHDVRNFFFLDTALPTLIKWSMRGTESRFACRLSAYEPLEAVLPFAGRVEWLWVDCFDGVPLNPELLRRLQDKFKICLVSPELQAAPLTDDFMKLLRDEAHAVCTKQPNLWKHL